MIYITHLFSFQVEYMFYSTSENPRLRVTKKEEYEYLEKGFVKVEESAICVVCDTYFFII